MGRRAADLLDNDPLMTSAEVSALFRVNPTTVTRWALAERLPSIRTPGGRLRFRRSVVEALFTP